MNVKIKLMGNGSLPEKQTEGAAAYDVYAPEDFKVNPGRQVMPLDFSIELPYGYEAKIEPRSGFSAKGMLDISHERKDADVIVGKVDSDFRGVVGVIIKSDEEEPFFIRKGERVAQLTVYKVEDVEWEVADNLSETERGAGGFGHTNE